MRAVLLTYNKRDMQSPAEEFSILREYAAGKISADRSFEQMYELYAPAVRNWARIAGEPAAADDLFQDTWLIFYNRWRSWSFQEPQSEPTGRPVLSFLYRTLHLVLRGYRRKRYRTSDSLDQVEVSNGSSHAATVHASIQLGQLLQLARKVCPPEELDVLMGKLGGLQAAEIASSIGSTAASVDHRFRNAIARLQKLAGKPGERRKHD